MKSLSITFAINGSINQNIKILTDDTPEQFFAKIKSGEYLTSICNNQVIQIPSFKVVGEIEGQGLLDDTEFLKPIAMDYFKEPIHEKLFINPQTYEGGYRDEMSRDETRRISQTYLHGELQEKNGYDIFGIVGEIPTYAGKYPCEVLGVSDNCTFFLWVGKDNLPHGLVVANSNEKDMAYAQTCFEQKCSHL